MANRVDMTSEQRKNTRPDIDRADVVFADGANGSYSIDYTDKNIPVVVVNDDIIKDAYNQTELISAVKKSLLKFKKVPIKGQDIYFIRDTQNEFLSSNYSRYLLRNDKQLYYDKMRIAGHTQDVVYATTDYINEGLKHPRKDNIVDFARGNILIDVSGRKYTAEVVIGFTKSGICELHDIVKINSTNFEYKKRATSKSMDSKESTRRDAPLNESISNSTEKVNNNFKKSARNSEYLELAKEPEKNKAKLQEMVNESAKEAMPNTKVLDEDGNLLVVYHGTDSKFTVFDKTKGRANMDIQGSFFSPWEIEASGYGSNVNPYYLNIVNPATEAVAYKALNRFKGQNGAGIKAREYLENLGYDGVNNENEEYIAFNSNQIKSADPVTYDDNGNVIPLEERFNENKEDIRYSSRNQYSKALTSDEWKKYNNAMTSGVDAGLRINDHSMLVECEKGDYSYKLVIYDNTFEENPIKAVYGIGNDDYSSISTHEVATTISNLEDKGYAGKIHSRILQDIAEVYGHSIGRYNNRSSRFSKIRGNTSQNTANTQNQSNGTGVSGTNSQTVKQHSRNQTALEQLEKVNKHLERENAKLAEDLKLTKEILNLQSKETKGKIVDPRTVRNSAARLIKNTNAHGNSIELSNLLKEA